MASSCIDAAGYEERRHDGTSEVPANLLVSFDAGMVTPSYLANALGIDTWDAFDGRPGHVATVALRVHPGHGMPAMALHIGQSAEDLRTLAAGCVRAADVLDGGKGRQ